MAPLIDSSRLLAYRDALSNWRFKDYIQFVLTKQAYRWIKIELGGISLKDIGPFMHDYVASGGEIDEVSESRPQWKDQFEFHHDLRFTIQDTPVYIETRLHYRIPITPDESWIQVVNIHAP